MHADQRAAYVQTGVGPDLLHRHRVAEGVIGGGGEGAARLGLGHHVDDVQLGYRLVLHDQRPVQVLAALGGDIHTHGAEHAVQPVENSLAHLRRGPAAHPAAHHLAGAAAHHHDLPLAQTGGLRQLPGGGGGLLPHLGQQIGIFYLMNDSCHDKTSFLRESSRLKLFYH